MNKIEQRISESAQLAANILSDKTITGKIGEITTKITEAFRNGQKVLFCGNGGSAAEAQHLASELSGRFYFDRPPLNAEACHVNSSFITAVSNDYDFSKTYSRYIESTGKKGDILVGLSTSGNSQNIVNAFIAARNAGMVTIAFTGKDGGKIEPFSDFIIKIPSSDVPRIQETHLLIGHIVCEIVEAGLFGKEK